MGDMADEEDVDGGWAWVILACGFTALFLNGFMCYSLGVIIEALLETFEEDLSVTAAVGSVLIGMELFTAPIASCVINRFGCRVCAMTGGVMALCGLVGAFFSKNLLSVLFTFGVVTGIGYGFAFTSANVIVGYYFRKLRPLAAGITVAGAGLGMFVGPPMIRYLIDMYTLHGAFLVLAGIASNFCLLGALMRPLKTPKTHKIREQPKVCKRITYRDCTSAITDCCCSKDFCSKEKLGFVFYLLSVCCWNCGEAASLLHLPNYSIQQGSSKQQTAFLFTVMGFTNVIARLLTGFAANDENINGLSLHMGQMGVACVLTMLFPQYSGTYKGQVIYSAGLGMYIGGANSLMSPMTVQLVGLKDLSTGFGLVCLFAGIGYMAGPPIAGAIVDLGASYTESYLFAAGMFLISSLSILIIPLVHRDWNVTSQDKCIEFIHDSNDNSND